MKVDQLVVQKGFYSVVLRDYQTALLTVDWKDNLQVDQMVAMLEKWKAVMKDTIQVAWLV